MKRFSGFFLNAFSLVIQWPELRDVRAFLKEADSRFKFGYKVQDKVFHAFLQAEGLRGIERHNGI
jgi:hypothetical protein